MMFIQIKTAVIPIFAVALIILIRGLGKTVQHDVDYWSRKNIEDHEGRGFIFEYEGPWAKYGMNGCPLLTQSGHKKPLDAL